MQSYKKQTYKTQADLADVLAHLAKDDAGMAEALARYGVPPLRKRADGFAGLIALLISQQVSTAAATAIKARFDAAFPKARPQDILAASDENLAACGISRPKQRYLRGLSAAVADGTLNPKALRRAPDDEVFAQLTALTGIGPWTADCYLLFCLGRQDCFPAGDLALQEGYRVLYRLNTRPNAKTLTGLSERWSPYRGAAARMLWTYYNGERQKT